MIGIDNRYQPFDLAHDKQIASRAQIIDFRYSNELTGFVIHQLADSVLKMSRSEVANLLKSIINNLFAVNYLLLSNLGAKR